MITNRLLYSHRFNLKMICCPEKDAMKFRSEFDVCRQVCRKDVMERSEMESFRNACNRYIRMLHSSGMRQHQIAV